MPLYPPTGATPDSVTRAADQAGLYAAHDAYGVTVGCTVTATSGNMVVSVAAGATQNGVPGTTATVIAQTVTASAASTTLPRYDLVVVSAAGVVSIVAGTAAAVPAIPTATAGSVELALLYIPAGTTVLTTAANVIDKRVMISTGAWINVKDYGARGDVRKYADGAITTGTATFTSATATFVAADKGKTITVAGAGAGGITLVTTISVVTNGTTVTLAANASTTVSAAIFGFGTDDAAAFTSAMTAVNAQPNGGVLFVPPGIYGFGSEVVHKLNVIVRGAGQDVTIIYLLNDLCNIFQEPNLGTPANTYQGVEDITLWGPGDRRPTQETTVTGTYGAGIRLSVLRADRVWWRRVHAIYSRQMSLTGVGGYEARAEQCVVEKGMRDGINCTGSKRMVAIGNTLQELPDDGIAFHIQAGLPTSTIVSNSCVVVGNIFYKSSGVKILGATNAIVSGNSGQFLYGYGAYFDYDATFGEGNKDTLGLSVTGNSFKDIINLSVLTGGGQISAHGIFMASPAPQQGATLGRTVTNGSTTAASANLTSATIAWTTADIGKSVTVTGAGVAGATLSTRILSITSGTIAVMETAASTTVTTSATITLSLRAYYPALMTAGTGTQAVKGVSTSDWSGMSGPATGSYGLVIANNTIINSLDGKTVSGNAAVNFSDYGFGNLWWTSGSQDFALVSNVSPSATQNYQGITLKDGGARDALVYGNTIYGFSSSIFFMGTAPQQPFAIIQGNKFTRAKKGVEIAYNAVTFVNFMIRDNYFDLDPLAESSERTLATGQPTGAWSRAAGNTAVGVYSFQSYGVHLHRNSFRNTCNLTTGNTEAVTLKDNIIFTDSSIAGGGGTVATDSELAQSYVVQIVEDPRLTTYGQLKNTTAYDQAPAAMPTTGAWAKNTVLRNSTPTMYGGVAIQGWLRLTSGTGNVAGTDWVALYTNGARPAAAAVSTPGAGFATDTLLAGSVVPIPPGLPQVLTTYSMWVYISKTAAGTATPIITIRFGTNGTTADTALLTFTFAAGTANADEGLFEVRATFRTVGAGTSAVLSGYCVVTRNGTSTGLSTSVNALTRTSSGFDSTTANAKLSASYNGGLSAVHTVSYVRAELVPN